MTRWTWKTAPKAETGPSRSGLRPADDSAQVAEKKVSAATPSPHATIPTSKLRRFVWIAVTAALLIGVAAGVGLFFKRPTRTLTDKDTVVLADFNNKTGDPVFDDTLKQALAVGLGQSPFLNILSDRRVRAVLGEMNRPMGERLTEDAAREVCQRAGSKAVISGSISSLGTEYVVGLNAINCATGDSLAREQVQAAGKEKVLDALGSAATKLREELGESLPSVQKFDVPLDQAMTPSLEALKAFSLGRQQQSDAASIPLFEQAIQLDPNFAAAYSRLGVVYSNLGQPTRAKEYTAKAFELRDHATERDRLYIAAVYYMYGTGELEKAIRTYQLWVQSYPRDFIAYANLAVPYANVGQYEKAVEATQESLKLRPDSVASYENLAGSYLALNKFTEMQETVQQAFSRKLDAEFLHTNLYSLAFLQGDTAAMNQQTSWFEGKAEVENEILGLESNTEAYFGRLDKARELTKRTIASAERGQNKEAAARWAAEAALREALFGNYPAAREQANEALGLGLGSRDAQSEAALSIAMAGDPTRASSLADDLNKRFPLDTLTQSVWLPAIRGQLDLNRRSPSEAIELLQAAVPFELGQTTFRSCVYPIYLRGKAYLASGQGAAAATEFQKILDHGGLVQNCPTSALAHLGLARAYAAQKDTVKALAAYQDFITLWKDADPNIPILQQAKTEYSKLK